MNITRQKIKNRVVIFLFFHFFIFLFSGSTVSTDDQVPVPVIQVDIGTFHGFDQGNPGWAQAGSNLETTWISQYIVALYNYGVVVAVILAVVMIMAGGFLWLTSAGSPDRVGKAKEFITAALSGLLLALFSFIILDAINPKLVKPDTLSVGQPSRLEILTRNDTNNQTGGGTTGGGSTGGANSDPAELNDFINNQDYQNLYGDEIDDFLNSIVYLEGPDIDRYTGIAGAEIDSAYFTLDQQIRDLADQGYDIQALLPINIADMPADGNMSVDWMLDYLNDQGSTVVQEDNGITVDGVFYNFISLNSQSVNLDQLGMYHIGTIILGNRDNP